jgi:DNA-binding transcriptional regulator YiaG
MSELSDAIRAKRGLYSQGDFAAKIGVTRQTVSAWEKGEAVPAPKAARRLHRMGIPAGLLLAGHMRDEAASVHQSAKDAA